MHKMDPTIFQTTTSVLSDQIQGYRNRQITAFREAVIAIGLITYGTIFLPKEILNHVFLFFVRLTGAAVCYFLSSLGCQMIMSYKTRIHELRRELGKLLIKEGDISTDLSTFNPEEKKNDYKVFFLSFLSQKDSLSPSSSIYAATLKLLGYFGLVVNSCAAVLSLYLIWKYW